MKIFLLLTLLISSLEAISQLNCKTVISNSEKTITCFHKNGQKSTVETWDKENRSGSIKAYNSAGNELFTYFLRTFGGHASVHINYFPNGQVEKVEYSSAPDGGIQFYRDSRKFNEKGEQIDFWKRDYPLETITTLKYEKPNQVYDSLNEKNYVVQVQEQAKHTTIFRIINTTNKKVKIEIIGQKNKWVDLKNQEIEITPNCYFMIDSINLINHTLEITEGYSATISKNMKKNTKYQLILAQPIISEKRTEYTWIVMKI